MSRQVRGITGDELLAFINNEEATLPNGKKGAGLFAYLRRLTSADTASAASTARDTVATVFKGVDNRMKSRYLLRDVVNKIAGSRDSTPHPGPLPGRGGEGVKSGGQKTERLRVIDWEQPANNDFLLVSQFSVTGALYTCRPDLVGFVNGLPLVVIELKKPGVPARAAFDENLTHHKAEIPQLFWFNALVIALNGTDSRVGPLTADGERFSPAPRCSRGSVRRAGKVRGPPARARR